MGHGLRNDEIADRHSGDEFWQRQGASVQARFFFFKQKTAYAMRISDWSQTCALPISVIAERPEAVAERLHAVDDEGADGGNVQRAGERLADADRPLEAVVVILRHIEARGGIELNRAVVEDRGGGQPAPFDSAEERRVGKEGVSRWRCRGAASH